MARLSSARLPPFSHLTAEHFTLVTATAPSLKPANARMTWSAHIKLRTHYFKIFGSWDPGCKSVTLTALDQALKGTIAPSTRRLPALGLVPGTHKVEGGN